MKKMKLKIFVNLKPEILDPQGEAILNSLRSIGFTEVTKVRQGKVIEIEIESTDKKIALNQANKMCKELLANVVIEDFKVEFI